MTTFDFSRQIVLNVNTTEDQNDGSQTNGLSLRDAILQANANPSKEYIINVPAGTYNLTIQNTIDRDFTTNLDTLKETRKTTGDLDIFGKITIRAEDPHNTIISGAGLQSEYRFFSEESSNSFYDVLTIGDRIFDVASGANLTLENVTVRDGLLIRDTLRGNIDTVPYGSGINIEAGGTATINNSIITNNISELIGGGINNNGTLTINDSMIKSNEVKEVNYYSSSLFYLNRSGGGIVNTGTMNINRSTITNNAVKNFNDFVGDTIVNALQAEGGGIVNGIEDNAIGNLTIVNSTIAGNSVASGSTTNRSNFTLGLTNGGGVLNRSNANIVNSTITNNFAQQGGGIYSEGTGSSISINNTIVADNKVQTEFSQTIRQPFPRFNFTSQSTNNFIEQFVWDVVDGNNILIQPPENITPFRDAYYTLRVLYKSADPFSPQPSEGFDITTKINLENLIFDQNADIKYVFNRYFGTDLDNFFSQANGFSSEDNNLVENVDQNFGFAYRNPLDNNNLVFLNTDFQFDDQGKLVLVLSDSTINPSTEFNQNIFIADKKDIFTFRTFNNALGLNDNNKSQASFVRDSSQNNRVFNYNDVVRFENRIIGTINTQITNPPSPTDITGFFNTSSSYNLIGASSVNGIFDGINNNIVGSVGNSLNPKLGGIQDSQGNIIAYQPLNDSPAINAGTNGIAQLRTFFGTEPVDQFGNPRINNGTVDIGSVESGFNNGGNAIAVLNDGDSLLNTSIYRFQNRNVPGTYLYAGIQEAQSIRSTFPNFVEEGVAFKVGVIPQDGLIPIYRFQNTAQPGTYLYTGEQERKSILTNNQNFRDEGIAFYVYGADANKGQNIYRFQNSSNPGTYLFVGEAEKNNILANFNNFRLEGVAFEVGI
ncbi:choice-of-anchor Q domain-containing protein [Geminocystis sp. GBBB08]|uniref:choice-of-anchor Q domain-containing protein n=1 Tax=Geminocystis sp. GBBB08 TaxID=2604140 RepID=UPI0027E37CC9|nr:choice-of-anchor Q domain-containing protein [Geminocystis sp. GBBB08]MBL1210947.1 hypothetical protein [Geminocystis sp. GBBB08]